MADPPHRKLSPRKPEFVLTVWRDPAAGAAGIWQCRLKSLRDGTEKLLADVTDLPRFLGEWPEPEGQHAQA